MNATSSIIYSSCVGGKKVKETFVKLLHCARRRAVTPPIWPDLRSILRNFKDRRNRIETLQKFLGLLTHIDSEMRKLTWV